MDGRTIAVGDIHGCLTALETLLRQLALRPEDRVVTLGDYIDRGPDSKGVLDRMLTLERECELIPLLGNHEEMLLHVLHENDDARYRAEWLKSGGAATLDSYGFATRPEDLPAEHLAFIERCRPWYEMERHAFLHANYDADRPFAEAHEYTLRWESLRERMPTRHISGKTVIVGHTAQASFEIFNRDYLICIDTKCYGGGWLTALDVETREYWQANQQAAVRHGSL